MNKLDKILNNSFLYNPIENWLWFLGILLVGLLFKRIFSVIVSKIVYRLIKQETQNIPVSNFVDLLKRPVEFIITLLIIYSAVDEISFPKKWRIIPFGKMRVSEFADKLLDTLFVIAITWIIIRLVKFFALVFLKKAEENDTKTDEHLVPFFRDIIIALVIFCSFFLILGPIPSTIFKSSFLAGAAATAPAKPNAPAAIPAPPMPAAVLPPASTFTVVETFDFLQASNSPSKIFRIYSNTRGLLEKKRKLCSDTIG